MIRRNVLDEIIHTRRYTDASTKPIIPLKRCQMHMDKVASTFYSSSIYRAQYAFATLKKLCFVVASA